MRLTPRGMSTAFVGGLGFFMVALPAVAQACAVCVGSSADDHGYFWGVLFLMAMPFLLGGSIGGWILYHYQRTRGVTLSDLVRRCRN